MNNPGNQSMKIQAMLLAALLLWSGMMTASAQTSAFTYQGSLTVNGSPAEGIFDFRFGLRFADQRLINKQ